MERIRELTEYRAAIFASLSLGSQGWFHTESLGKVERRAAVLNDYRLAWHSFPRKDTIWNRVFKLNKMKVIDYTFKFIVFKR